MELQLYTAHIRVKFHSWVPASTEKVSHDLGSSGLKITDVSEGKYFKVELEAESDVVARQKIDAICKETLVNPTIETHEYDLVLKTGRDEIIARKNLERLRLSPYPGRGIVVGLDQTGKSMVQIYWIMGRSENSRNRIFGCDGGRVFTEAADPTKVKDPSLIIYNAMDERPDVFVVSNGSQTDAMLRGILGMEIFSRAVRSFQYEPDAPNFTPRITAVSVFELRSSNFFVGISVLRKSRWGDSCDRSRDTFENIGHGFGLCVTTYSGENVAEGDPLPWFRGEPYLVPLEGDAAQIAQTFWNVLDESNRVSLVVKEINVVTKQSSVKIINKYEKI